MLNNVAIQMNRANRQRVMRDPNSIDCVLFTKLVDRDGGGTDVDGSSLMGGAGVMLDEDEVNYSWVMACDARIHFSQGFASSLGNTSDDDGRIDYADGLIEASIEQVPEVGADGYVLPDKRQLVAVIIGGGIIVNYEIVGVTGNVNIPPFTRRYLLNPRPDESVSGDL